MDCTSLKIFGLQECVFVFGITIWVSRLQKRVSADHRVTRFSCLLRAHVNRAMSLHTLTTIDNDINRRIAPNTYTTAEITVALIHVAVPSYLHQLASLTRDQCLNVDIPSFHQLEVQATLNSTPWRIQYRNATTPSQGPLLPRRQFQPPMADPNP